MKDGLISRKALLEDFRKTITESSDTTDWLNMINRQPTAYNVEKVVKKMEKEIKNLECNLVGDCEDDIIAIIKGGGVE